MGAVVRTAPLFLTAAAVVGCAGSPDGETLSRLRGVEPDATEVRVEDGLQRAMVAYRAFLDEAPESSLTPEAMRRLADLKLEKEYGVLGDADAALPAPEKAQQNPPAAPAPWAVADVSQQEESARDFERRASQEKELGPSTRDSSIDTPGGVVAGKGPLGAIALYDEILDTYPDYEHNDNVLYQKARAFDELGRSDEAIAVIERLVAEYPGSRHLDEVQFRRAEYFFVRRKYLDAEEAYQAITRMGPTSEYYELALYKLGWTFYKQHLHEEALQQYVALLDHKVSAGYDFARVGNLDTSQGEGAANESDERRVADTFRVVSLSFSELGGDDAVQAYFREHGARPYENHVYRRLAEFYLEKLRYHDAAETYQRFVDLYPLHRESPHFGMRVVSIYEAGGFPKLVLEAKKDFAARYGLQSAYWNHLAVEDSPEVIAYLKSNLADLANHYHALYQDPERENERVDDFSEASRWYLAYLASFPATPETPGIHYQLGDLLLEHEEFGRAAREYERIAYDYPDHGKSAAAGYAAIYAHRKHLDVSQGEGQDLVRRDTVTSTLRFVERFPQHEQAPAVLGAAVDDLYQMQEFDVAKATGRRLIDEYPDADLSIRRGAWIVVAHASFELGRFQEAEPAYAQLLAMTPDDDESRQGFVENLAASIYKQGELAREAGDGRAAADHFLRVARLAPTSEIRPVAEYDAGAALVQLQDWEQAAQVLEAFRETYPGHELHREATKQMAFVYREQGDLARAADEYQRIATEAEDPELQREALLSAADLYEEADATERALAVYLEYVAQFPRPLELAMETRFKIAGMYKDLENQVARREQLRLIVEIDSTAGPDRTERIRYLAAHSSLVLSEDVYERFTEAELVQPFEVNLKEKQRRMDAALDTLGRLVDYEVGEVTAAATFYMAEVYRQFGRSMVESERPAGLTPAETADYELVLEEEAFPFEEKAIDVHEKNVELMAAGIFNRWIERSLSQLAQLMPGRYAKPEASSGLIASIDTWAYRTPGAPRQDGSPEHGASPEERVGRDPSHEPEPTPDDAEDAADGVVATG